MSVYEIKLKTHSREDVTKDCGVLNVCALHGRPPRILKIVAGRDKSIHFVAICKDDDCGKISYNKEETVNAWNKYNPPFKLGDKIMLLDRGESTIYSCDHGIFKCYEGDLVVWESNLGGIYKTPASVVIPEGRESV